MKGKGVVEKRGRGRSSCRPDTDRLDEARRRRSGRLALPGLGLGDVPVVARLDESPASVGVDRGEAGLEEARLGANAHLSPGPRYRARVELHAGAPQPEAHAAGLGRQGGVLRYDPVGQEAHHARDSELLEADTAAYRVSARLVGAALDLGPTQARPVPAARPRDLGSQIQRQLGLRH
jgi:hypothetical protein